MTSVNKFSILSKLNTTWKKKIKRYHVFYDTCGVNAFFIDSADQVYGFGSNFDGVLGLGHNNYVTRPSIIPELCDVKIIKFINGKNFCLALTDNGLFGWGVNNHGQLGQFGLTTDNDEPIYLKPLRINFFNDEPIDDVCVGSGHVLVLLKTSEVYSWGQNIYGEVGCGVSDAMVTFPTELDIFKSINVKSIHCSFEQSFAVTTDGYVYSWGRNQWHQLGHMIGREELVGQPKKVNIEGVRSVCSSSYNTYFLLMDGTVLFTGSYYPKTPKKIFNYYHENSLLEMFQILPGILKENFVCDEISSQINWQTKQHLACGLSSKEKLVHGIWVREIFESKQDNFFDYYLDEAQMTFEIIQNVHVDDTVASSDNSTMQLNYLQEDRFNLQFELIKEMGQGGYGKVFQVKDKLDDKIWCIKIIKGKHYIFSILYHIPSQTRFS